MKNVKQRRFESQGQALIGLLVVIAIILIVMAAMNGGGGHKTIYGNAIQRADVTVCGAYTSQIRDAIVMYRQDYNQNPPNLEALSKYGVRPEMYNSPGCVYSYDPSTGEVSAPDTRPGAAGRAAMGGGQG
jgi:type II secretory pathway pseudopilin PulG